MKILVKRISRVTYITKPDGTKDRTNTTFKRHNKVYKVSVNGFDKLTKQIAAQHNCDNVLLEWQDVRQRCEQCCSCTHWIRHNCVESGTPKPKHYFSWCSLFKWRTGK